MKNTEKYLDKVEFSEDKTTLVKYPAYLQSESYAIPLISQALWRRQ